METLCIYAGRSCRACSGERSWMKRGKPLKHSPDGNK
jgi:hypothetical protein